MTGQAEFTGAVPVQNDLGGFRTAEALIVVGVSVGRGGSGFPTGHEGAVVMNGNDRVAGGGIDPLPQAGDLVVGGSVHVGQRPDGDHIPLPGIGAGVDVGEHGVAGQAEFAGAVLIQNELRGFGAAQALIVIGEGTGSRFRLGRSLFGFLHVAVIAVDAVPVGHQALMGQDLFIGVGGNVGGRIEADQGVGAVVQRALHGEIQADGVGVLLAVVHTGFAEQDLVAQVRQGRSRVAAAELAGAPEAAVGTGAVGNRADQILILVAHNTAGEEGEFLGFLLGIGVGDIDGARGGCQRVVGDKHPDVGILGQDAGDYAPVVAHGHLGAAGLVAADPGSHHFTVDGVFHLVRLVNDLAHLVDVFPVDIFQIRLQEHGLALAAVDGILAEGGAEEMHFPVTGRIHMLLDPGLGDGGNVHAHHELIVAGHRVVGILADGAGTAGNHDLDSLFPSLDQAVLQSGDLAGQDHQHLDVHQNEILHLRALGGGRIVGGDHLDVIAQGLEHFDQRLLLQHRDGAGLVLHAHADDLGAFGRCLASAPRQAADQQHGDQQQTYYLLHFGFLLIIFYKSKDCFFLSLFSYCTIILTFRIGKIHWIFPFYYSDFLILKEFHAACFPVFPS